MGNVLSPVTKSYLEYWKVKFNQNGCLREEVAKIFDKAD